MAVSTEAMHQTSNSLLQGTAHEADIPARPVAFWWQILDDFLRLTFETRVAEYQMTMAAIKQTNYVELLKFFNNMQLLSLCYHCNLSQKPAAT